MKKPGKPKPKRRKGGRAGASAPPTLTGLGAAPNRRSTGAVVRSAPRPSAYRGAGSATARSVVYIADDAQALSLLLLPFVLMAMIIGLTHVTKPFLSLPLPYPAIEARHTAPDAPGPLDLARRIAAVPRLSLSPVVAPPLPLAATTVHAPTLVAPRGSAAVGQLQQVTPTLFAAATPEAAPAPLASALPPAEALRPSAMSLASVATSAVDVRPLELGQTPGAMHWQQAAPVTSSPPRLAEERVTLSLVPVLSQPPASARLADEIGPFALGIETREQPLIAGAKDVLAALSPSLVPSPRALDGLAPPPAITALEHPLPSDLPLAAPSPAGICLAPPTRQQSEVASALLLPPDPARFGQRLAEAARAQSADLVIYTDRYKRLAYPMGDVAPLYGVCTDVVIRAYRALGLDLQALVHQARVGSGDTNIDHRRVDTLRRFFAARGAALPVTDYPEDYQPGDIVTYYRPQNRHSRTHIAIVADEVGPSGRPMIIHNRGWGPQVEDALFVDQVTGHYRFHGSAPDTHPVPAALVHSPSRPPAPGVAAAKTALHARPSTAQCTTAAEARGRPSVAAVCTPAAVSPAAAPKTPPSPPRRREARAGSAPAAVR